MLTEESQDNKKLFNMLVNSNRRRRKHTGHSFSNASNRNDHNSFNENGTNQDQSSARAPKRSAV